MSVCRNCFKPASDHCDGFEGWPSWCKCDPKSWGNAEAMKDACDAFSDPKAIGMCARCEHDAECHA